MKISEPGVYDISAEDYHADPCVEPSLSSSIVKVLVDETPQHAWTAHPRYNPDLEREEDKKFDLGNAAHSLMLHDPKKFAILEFDDFKTKVAKEARDRARSLGHIPLLSKHWADVQAMVEAGRLQLACHDDAQDAFTNGKPEQTLIWVEEIDGMKVHCRIRLDFLPDNHVVFDDYKTTGSADPDAWARIVFSDVRHDIQSSFYRRGIRKVLGVRKPRVRFIVQEVKRPFALCAIELNNEAHELADRQIEQAMRKWVWCRRSGMWPGYPRKTCTIGPPEWREAQLMKREERDAELAERAGVRGDHALLALGIEFHKPL